jgi:hypothetical protein
MALITRSLRKWSRSRLLSTVFAAFSIGLSWATLADAGTVSALHRYGLAGVEVRASSSEGTFVGGAAESRLSGMVWKAVVRHTPLTRKADSPALITGGSVTLHVPTQNPAFEESRSFNDGTITYAADRSSGASCGAQVFRVNATLDATNAGEESGALQVFLTHHRRLVFGRCLTYAATVRGSLRL